MKYKVTLNGKIYEVEVEKGEAVLLKEYAAAAPAPTPAAAAPAAPAAPAPAPAAPAASANLGAGRVVGAPLPGTVLQVKGSEGQKVKAGETIIIIEAMKMENEVVAPVDGTITSIVAQKGAAVQANDPLFTIA